MNPSNKANQNVADAGLKTTFAPGLFARTAHDFREILTPDWSQWVPRAALRCIPGVALPLILGIYFNHPGIGIFATGGAMSVGFGSNHRLSRSRLSPMLIASTGMAVSALAGSLAGHSLLSLLPVVAFWGFVYGLLATLGSATAFIGLQCVIAMLITSNYTVPFAAAFNRATMVLIGGLGQTLLVAMLWKFDRKSPAPNPPPDPQNPATAQPSAKNVYDNLTWQSDAFQYGLRVAIALIYASILARALNLTNGYWLAMTVAIVLKPSFGKTFQRGLARILGTLAGVAVATLVSALLHPSHETLAALVILFAALSYLLIRVNYASFTVCITAYIVFLLALAGLPEQKIIRYRALNTVLGGGLALVMHGKFPKPGHRRPQIND
ncbi:MAG: FUSC family protein [Planctomycetota bacterium]|nr:FUSC family protein [Planctomycetota bacterium]